MTVSTQAADLVDLRAGEVPTFKVPVVDGKQSWTSLPPKGVSINVWSPDGAGMISMEDFEGEKSFVLRNTGVKPSVFLTLKEPYLDVELATGKTYEVSVSYGVAGDPRAEMVLKAASADGSINVETDATQAPGKQEWKIELPSEPSKWNTIQAKLKVTDGKGRLEVNFTTSKSGEENLLAIRSVQVKEVAP